MVDVEKGRIRVEVTAKMDEVRSIQHTNEGQSGGSGFLAKFFKPFEPTKPQAQRLKVLVCEDERIIRLVLKKTLEENDLDVTLTDNPVSYLSRERLHNFDFIITDNRMPYMWGTQFIEYVENHLRLDIPMYIYSGDPYLKKELSLTKVLRGIFEKGSGIEGVLQTILADYQKYRAETDVKMEMNMAMASARLMI